MKEELVVVERLKPVSSSLIVLEGNMGNSVCFCSVQVIKVGTALGRSVDLTRFHGYDELISELDQMFDFNGSLIDGNSGFHIAYMDDEGDMMLVGDNPWQLSSKTF